MPATALRRRLALRCLEDRTVPSTVWTQRGGDPGHSGYANVTVNAAQIAEAWSQPITYPSSGYWDQNGNRGLAIDGTRVYRTELGDWSDGNYRIMAFDLATGVPVWNRVLVGNGHVSAPSVAGGYVYVNRGGVSGSGVGEEERPWLYQLDAATGATVTRATYESQWGASDERPVIAGDQLVCYNGYYGGLGSWSVPGLAANWAVGGPMYEAPHPALSATSIYFNGGVNFRTTTKVYARATGDRLNPLAHPSATALVEPVVSGSGRVLVGLDEPGRTGVAAYSPTNRLLWTRAAARRGAAG
jgi:hypothetical protein